MKNTFMVLAMLIALLIGSPAFSQTSTDALSTCLVDQLNGKERKSLAKWIFFAIGAHPEIKSFLNASPSDIQASDKIMGALITRLLTVDCSAQLRTAYSSDPASIEKAFEVVGKIAMQELMTSDEVQKAITNYAQFADRAKIGKALSPK